MLWTIDPAHSEINFAIRHMMISNVRGRFEKFSGNVDFNEETPAASSVDVKIEAASMNTRDSNRDAHLRSPDFLNADQYPNLTFRSRTVEVVDSNHGRIHGELTMRDITRPVTLEVEYSGQAKSPWGTTSAGFTAHAVINRKEWDLTWNRGLETGGMLVGDELKVDIELEIIKQPEAQEKAVA
ncbi:MAG TPA: YceI family protein [Anaerolineaceae bacterium]